MDKYQESRCSCLAKVSPLEILRTIVGNEVVPAWIRLRCRSIETIVWTGTSGAPSTSGPKCLYGEHRSASPGWNFAFSRCSRRAWRNLRLPTGNTLGSRKRGRAGIRPVTSSRGEWAFLFTGHGGRSSGEALWAFSYNLRLGATLSHHTPISVEKKNHEEIRSKRSNRARP